MTARRRDYGSGSLKEVRPGVYELRWRTGTDPFTGRSRQLQETFRGTKKAAQQRLAELVASSRQRSTVTLGQLLFAVDDTATIAASTRVRYRYALAHLPEPMRAMPLERITPPVIAGLHRELQRRGVGPQTIHKLHTALGAAFRYAVEWGWCERNPCRGVRTPTIPRRAYALPTVEQLHRLVELADELGPSHGTWMRLSIATGARRGEVLGLRWCDVELAAGIVRITGTLTDDLDRKEPKTGAGVRSVTLDAATAEHLRGWRVRVLERALSVGAKLAPDAWVIADDPACQVPWRPGRASLCFSRLAERVGCAEVRYHDLRHAHATLLIEAGVTTRTVGDRLGHSRPSTTQNIYGHVLPGADAAAAETFGRLLGRQG